MWIFRKQGGFWGVAAGKKLIHAPVSTVPLPSFTHIHLLVGGWPTPLKNIKGSLDDDIPNIWKNRIHVPNHQPVYYILIFPAFPRLDLLDMENGVWKTNHAWLTRLPTECVLHLPLPWPLPNHYQLL
jgi:hypothetical protein